MAADKTWREGAQVRVGPSAAIAGAEWARKRFGELGIDVPEDNRLQRAIRLLSDFAGGGEVREDGVDLQRRISDAHRTAVEFYIIARAAGNREGTASDLKKSKIATALGGADTEADEVNPHARNTQFELYAGAMLTMGGAVVALAEPDLVMLFLGEEAGIAAKRVRSEKQIRKRFKEGLMQIERSGRSGFVALNLDRLARKTKRADGAEAKGRAFDEAIDPVNVITPLIENQPNLLGVMVFGSTTEWDFTGEKPRMEFSTFRKIVLFADGEAEETAGKEFFEAVEAEIDRRIKLL